MTARCFWCQQGKPGPQDLEPCTTCAASWARGVTLFEARTENDGPEYTGRWAVVTEEVIPLLFKKDFVALVMERRKALIEPALFDELFAPKGDE